MISYNIGEGETSQKKGWLDVTDHFISVSTRLSVCWVNITEQKHQGKRRKLHL